MADSCKVCGSQLVAGQRFCRLCGTEVDVLEEMPTQMLGAQPAAATPFSTAPLSAGRSTNSPLPPAQATAYQPPYAPQASSAQLQPPPCSSSSRYIILALFALIAVALAAGIYARVKNGGAVQKRLIITKPDAPKAPSAPTNGAEASGSKSVITNSYPLNADATFSINNFNGDIEIVGWDEPRAEVTITKSGGSQSDQSAVDIKVSNSKDALSFDSTSLMSRGINVSYEVKLPRTLREVTITSMNSSVALTNFSGPVSIKLQNGGIDLKDVSGAVSAKTINGSIEAVFDQTKPTDAQNYSTVNGDVNVQLAPSINADLKAETISGKIKIDDELGIPVEKQMVGQKASGSIGKGGPTLTAKTINGSIEISK